MKRAMMAVFLFGAVLAWGCGTGGTGGKDGKPVEHESDRSHEAHEPGPHKGAVEDFGKDGKHHTEVVYDKDKKEMTVYVLGEDEKTAKPIKTDKLTLRHPEPVGMVELKAVPLEGEKDGTSSRFVGKVEKLDDKGPTPPYEISGTIDGKPYHATYKKPKK